MASKNIITGLTNLTQIQFTQDGKYVWFGDEEIGYRQIFPTSNPNFWIAESGWEGSEFILYAIGYQDGKTKEIKQTPWIRLDKLKIKGTVASSVKLVHGDREKIIIQTFSHLIFLDWNGNLIRSFETPCHHIWTLKIALNEQYAAFVDTESRSVWIFNFQTEQWHTFRKKEILHSAAVQWQENTCVIATAKAILFFECVENEWNLKKKYSNSSKFCIRFNLFSKTLFGSFSK